MSRFVFVPALTLVALLAPGAARADGGTVR